MNQILKKNISTFKTLAIKIIAVRITTAIFQLSEVAANMPLLKSFWSIHIKQRFVKHLPTTRDFIFIILIYYFYQKKKKKIEKLSKQILNPRKEIQDLMNIDDVFTKGFLELTDILQTRIFPLKGTQSISEGKLIARLSRELAYVIRREESNQGIDRFIFQTFVILFTVIIYYLCIFIYLNNMHWKAPLITILNRIFFQS